MENQQTKNLCSIKSLQNFFKKTGAITPSSESDLRKIFRRKPDPTKNRTFKKTNNQENISNQIFSYISPDKIDLRHPTKSIESLCSALTENKQEYPANNNSYCLMKKQSATSLHQGLEGYSQKGIQYATGSHKLIYETNQDFAFQQQLLNYRTLYRELLRKNEKLQIASKDQKQRINLLHQQNSYLYCKLEQLTDGQIQSCKNIKQLQYIVSIKDKQITKCKQELQIQKKNLEMIELLNDKLMDNTKNQDTETSGFLLNQNNAELENDQSKQSEKLAYAEQQLLTLRQRIKYFQICQVMLQRTKYENQSLFIENAKLKTSNRKYIKKIQVLLSKLQNLRQIQKSQVRNNSSFGSVKQIPSTPFIKINQFKKDFHRNISNNDSDIFELSPEKNK